MKTKLASLLKTPPTTILESLNLLKSKCTTVQSVLSLQKLVAELTQIYQVAKELEITTIQAAGASIAGDRWDVKPIDGETPKDVEARATVLKNRLAENAKQDVELENAPLQITVPESDHLALLKADVNLHLSGLVVLNGEGF